MAFITSQIFVSLGRPPGNGAGIKGLISSHWSWVRLVEYDLLIALSGAVVFTY
jgi:hypothetical protein